MSAVLTAALLLPITAHTTTELADWYQDWLATPAPANVMLAELADMRQRHPCFPEACPEPVTTRAVNSGMGSDVEQWRTLVAAYFPADQVERALSIMACESGGNPNAYNPSGASGLMQILATWADNFGYTPAQLFDPNVNLQIARYLWDDAGFSHWVCQ